MFTRAAIWMRLDPRYIAVFLWSALNVSILHYALGKNASQLRFGRVLVAFWSRFGRVLVTNIAKTQNQRIV